MYSSWYPEFSFSIWKGDNKPFFRPTEIQSAIQKERQKTIKMRYNMYTLNQADMPVHIHIPTVQWIKLQLYLISLVQKEIIIVDKKVHSLSNRILHFCCSYCRLAIKAYLNWMEFVLLLPSTWQNLSTAVWASLFNIMSWSSNSCYLPFFMCVSVCLGQIRMP